MVPEGRLELPPLTRLDFESSASTIPPLGQTHKIYCVFCVLRTVCPSVDPHRFALGKNKAVCFYPTRATCPAKLYAKWGYRLILHGF